MRTRLREYGLVLACALGAATVGAAIDLVTSQSSWEYFFYGKDLRATLGAALPPDSVELALSAARLGAASSGWVGALFGVAMTRVEWNRGDLLSTLAVVLAGATLGGIAGFFRLLPMTGAVAEVAASELLRPEHFLTVYGAHLGAYAGALAGFVWWLAQRRRTGLRTITVFSVGSASPKGCDG